MGRDADERLNRLIEKARRAPFVELVDQLEREQRPEIRVGMDGPPDREVVRFRHDPSLAFPSGDIRGARLAQHDSGGTYVELQTTFMGLFGQSSPLPNYIVEEILGESDGSPRRDFLDMFHHRLLGLLFRGMTRLQYHRHFEREHADAGSQRLLCLSGLDLHGDPDTGHLSHSELLILTPLLSMSPGSMHALRSGLDVLFQDDLEGGEIRVVEHCGGLVDVPPHQRARLGRNMRLGRSGALGDTISHRASAVRVELGPLSQSAFDRFGPGGERLGALCDAMDLLLHRAIDYDISLIPGPTASQGFQLSAHAQNPLGRTTWLRGSSKAPLTMRSPREAIHES